MRGLTRWLYRRHDRLTRRSNRKHRPPFKASAVTTRQEQK